jgi:hypothetical protein
MGEGSGTHKHTAAIPQHSMGTHPSAYLEPLPEWVAGAGVEVTTWGGRGATADTGSGTDAEPSALQPATIQTTHRFKRKSAKH